MLEERGGWFIKNVRDAEWFGSPRLGKSCAFDGTERFPEVGIRIWVMEPGKPNCRYHRESSQENMLVLSGRCRLIVNGEEHPLKTWDFVHLPAGVTHVLVGEGDKECAVLMTGKRPVDELYYPAEPKAAAVDAQGVEPTADPRVAYGDIKEFGPCEKPEWPPHDR